MPSIANMVFNQCRKLKRRNGQGPRLILTVCLLCLSCVGYAANARRIAMQGNGRGAAACAACHGLDGDSQQAAGFPYLAGLDARYLRRQLDAMADGTRAAPVMRPIAAVLSPDERAALAIYYSRMRNRTQPDMRLMAAPGLGETLAMRGRWSQQLPACEQCHGPQGRGAGEYFPALAGQPAAYLAAQLQAFRQGLRRDDPLGLMRHIATLLNSTDIAAVAAWYAAQPADAAHQQPRAGASTVPSAESMEPVAAAAADHGSSSSHQAMLPFTPPDETQMPAGPLGDAVRQGRAIFLHTRDYAPAYARNALSCGNCHLDAGRHADSAPLWAAYVRYPIYSRKSRRVDTFGERLQECFRFSLNGRAPPLDSPVLVALESYARWLATGAPVGAALPGAGYPKADQAPPQPPDYRRGAQVYQDRCALCHGAEGQGLRITGRYVFPPVWGAQSYNWGAGMQELNQAAAFIRANMPLGMGGSLTTQGAWDVAMYINAHERPQDPRYTGNIAVTRARYHNSPWSLYGTVVNGHLLGSAPARPGPVP